MKKAPVLSGMSRLPVETKAGFAVFQGRGLFPRAEGASPGVAAAWFQPRLP